jgi:uncharacterized membrane protein YedE/YeeE
VLIELALDMWRPPTIAGIGSIAFSVLSFTAVTLVNSPGGGYAESTVTDYLAASHFPVVLLGLCMGLLGVVGLLCLLSYLRELIGTGADEQQLGSVFWGTGVASAACFAVGWGFVAGQPVAHAEAGSALAVPPTVTHLISETGGSVMIFGSGSMLLGLALAILFLKGAALPTWLRWLTLIAAIAAFAGLAFFPFALVLLWGVVVGLWLLIAGGRRQTSRA